MDTDDPERPQSLLRRALPWLSVIVLVAAIYDGAIFYSRWSGNQAIERARDAKETERAQKMVELTGGDTLKISNFYALPGAIPAGGHSTICYSVNGAKTLRLEPPVEEVWPALSHCFDVSPRRDTEYKLIAEDGGGHSVFESLVIKIKR